MSKIEEYNQLKADQETLVSYIDGDDTEQGELI